MAGPIASAADRLIVVLLVVLAASTVYNSLVAPQPGSHVRPTAAALLSGAVPACKYGSQPYYFVDSERAQFNETPTSWHVHAYNPKCQPRALLDSLVSGGHSNGSRTGSDADGCSVDRDRQLTAIIYGDSIDRLMVEHLCKMVRSKLVSDPGPEPIREKRYVSTTWCQTDRFLVMHTWTNGMMPQDKEVFTPAEAFKRSSELFRNLTGKTSPDIVLFASCLWDLHSWINVGGDDTLFSAKQGTTAQPCLGEDRLRLYMSNMQAYVDMLRTGFPDTRLLAVRTTNPKNPRSLLAYGALDWPAWGESALRLPPGHSKQLLWNNWIAALNTALRHMAAEDGLPVIDLEALALQLPAAYLYSGDGLHPQPQLLVTVMLNLLLNEYERRSCGGVSDA